jgi:hypothetical protein
MGEVHDDGAGQFTVRQLGGAGFVHVGVAGGEVTVGCSTSMRLRECLLAVCNVAYGHNALRKNMGNGGAAHATIQGYDTANPQTSSFTIYLGPEWARTDELAEKITKEVGPTEIAVIRVDVGSSSWQWDDLSATQGPGRWAFGGLGDHSVATALLDVMDQVADEWAHLEFKERGYGILARVGVENVD